MDLLHGISKNGSIPWNNSIDMKRFKDLTCSKKNNCVIYGKNTFLSLPSKYRCLPNRHNIIISSSLKNEDIDKMNYTKTNYSLFDNLDNAINFAKNSSDIDDIYICGGSQIYKEVISKNIVDIYYLSFINDVFFCDNNYPFDDMMDSLQNKIYNIKKEKFEDIKFIDIYVKK